MEKIVALVLCMCALVSSQDIMGDGLGSIFALNMLGGGNLFGNLFGPPQQSFIPLQPRPVSTGTGTGAGAGSAASRLRQLQLQQQLQQMRASNTSPLGALLFFDGFM